MAGKVYIISAPSGSGKSTLVNQLSKLVDNLEFSVSYTTRAPRGSEQDGNEYHFIDRARFESMIAANAFLEHACVFGNYYGTAASQVESVSQTGKDLILDIDVQGAEQVMHRLPSATSIFILPPGPEVLEMRLRNRSRAEDAASHRVTPEEVIQKRLSEARRELNRVWSYEYAVVNDQLEEAVNLLRSIVLCARAECVEEDRRAADASRTCRPGVPLLRALRQFGINLPAGARDE